MKIKETRERLPGGFGNSHRMGMVIREVRVRALAPGETRPPEAAEVADETPEHDWQPEEDA